MLSQEGLIANNAVSFLKQQSERFYEISDKYTAECARFISDNLPEITDDPEKFFELISRAAEEYGIERCKAVLANEYRLANQQLLTPETADYLANISADQNDRFRINSPPIVLDMLTAAIRKVEGLSESETKLFRSGLVNGDREQVQSQSTQIKTEIDTMLPSKNRDLFLTTNGVCNGRTEIPVSRRSGADTRRVLPE